MTFSKDDMNPFQKPFNVLPSKLFDLIYLLSNLFCYNSYVYDICIDKYIPIYLYIYVLM